MDEEEESSSCGRAEPDGGESSTAYASGTQVTEIPPARLSTASRTDFPLYRLLWLSLLNLNYM